MDSGISSPLSNLCHHFAIVIKQGRLSLALTERMADRYHHIRLLYGEEGLAKLSAARLLIVGAGGIGCEVKYTHFF